MDKKVSAKRNGKWWSYGRLNIDPKYGNLRLSFKNTPELKELVNNGGDWLNFSLFDNEQKEQASPPRDNLDDDLPF